MAINLEQNNNPMQINMSTQYWQWVQQAMATGKYSSLEVLFEQALDALKLKEAHDTQLHQALQLGLESGFDSFDAEAFKQKMAEKYNG
jgi:Arc/MetJ-type ribon-helix-helix transcriptional regulator